MGSDSYDITVKQEAKFLRITVTGEFSTRVALRGFDRVAEEAKRHGANRVLIDASRLVGAANQSQQYEVGKYVAAHIPFRCAIIHHPDRRSYFAEWTAVTGGADIRLFLEELRAITWLLRD